MVQGAEVGSRLLEGSPPQHLARHLGLGGSGGFRASRAAGLSVLAGWAPLALLSAATGGLGTSGLLSFAPDLAVHSRSVLAAPLLILADVVCGPRLGAITRHFMDAGLVPEHQRERFEAAVASTGRLHGSPAANTVLLTCAYGLTLGLLLSAPPTWYPAWQVQQPMAEGGGPILRSLSIAGWWHTLVSLPLLILLLLAWLWRLGLWTRLLWLVSRADLRLVPSHPDRCAGLKFLGYSLRAFGPVALALGLLGAGRMANNAVHLGVSPFTHRYAVVIGMAVIVAILLCPLLVFTPRLMTAWRRGVFEYGELADRLGRGFEQKWLAERLSAEQGLAAPDFSAVIDAYSIIANVYAMRLVPVDLKSIAVLAGAVLLPFLPLAFFALPLDTIFRTLARVFV